jgi:hypothetical protein
VGLIDARNRGSKISCNFPFNRILYFKQRLKEVKKILFDIRLAQCRPISCFLLHGQHLVASNHNQKLPLCEKQELIHAGALHFVSQLDTKIVGPNAFTVQTLPVLVIIRDLEKPPCVLQTCLVQNVS